MSEQMFAGKQCTNNLEVSGEIWSLLYTYLQIFPCSNTLSFFLKENLF